MTYKLNHMQNVFKAACIVTFSLILAACGNTTKDEKGELNDKKAELQKLKGEQKKMLKQELSLKKHLDF